MATYEFALAPIPTPAPSAIHTYVPPPPLSPYHTRGVLRLALRFKAKQGGPRSIKNLRALGRFGIQLAMAPLSAFRVALIWRRARNSGQKAWLATTRGDLAPSFQNKIKNAAKKAYAKLPQQYHFTPQSLRLKQQRPRRHGFLQI